MRSDREEQPKIRCCFPPQEDKRTRDILFDWNVPCFLCYVGDGLLLRNLDALDAASECSAITGVEGR